jgi:hypothetical protein
MAKNISWPIPGGIMYLLKRIVLLAGILLVFSCDFPGAPRLEETYLTVNFPGARNARSGLSRSVLPDSFIGALEYKVTFTGPGETVIEETVEGGSINIFLAAGDWIITAEAYDPNVKKGSLVGRGEAEVALVPGQPQSVTILMYVDSDYEAGLTDIYIHNEAELRRIGAAEDGLAINNSARTFYLMNDITLTQPWTPIGSGGYIEGDIDSFKAVFDGQGHTVTVRAFSPDAMDLKNVGFFGVAEGAEIKNLNLTYELDGPIVSAHTDDLTAGGLVGEANYTTIKNVTVAFDGSDGFRVSIAAIDTEYNQYANSRIGGVAGYLSDGDISGCHVRGNVQGVSATANWISIGGIAGDVSGSNEGNVLEKSSFTGLVYGSCANSTASRAGVDAGGIVGNSARLTIDSCYVAGQVKAEGYVAMYAGGIHGNSGLAGSDMYVYAEVSAAGLDPSKGSAYAGGITGNSDYYDDGFSNAYVAGKVSAGGSADNKAGGIAGTIRTRSDLPTDPAIDNCIVLLTALDGGASSNVYIIGDKDTSTTTGSSTQVWDAIAITRGSSTYKEGTTNLLSNLSLDPNKDMISSFTRASTYYQASAGYPAWDFANTWKLISGYDYPVLSWQTTPPDLSFVPDSFEIIWP